MCENELSHTIIGAAIEVHKELGPGLLESVYEEALCWELKSRGVPVERQIEVPVFYKGHRLATQFRLDILVDRLVIVECKSVIQDHPIFQAQCLTHLRLSNKKLGLVINFGQQYLRDGIHRVVNKLTN